MSTTSLLVEGDEVKFIPLFPGGGMLTSPITSTFVKSKSKNQASFRGITVEGDEKAWVLPVCLYIIPPFTLPGTVKCAIQKLDESHIAKKIIENEKSVLLVGTTFTAEFQVISRAKMPNGVEDPNSQYLGKGQFIQINDSNASQTIS